MGGSGGRLVLIRGCRLMVGGGDGLVVRMLDG